jgi:mono/diheme cytochrome c family protein
MRAARLNLVLLVAVIGVLALNWILEFDRTERNFLILPGMVIPVAYESFSANPTLPGGLTEQPPPPGTIPWGGWPLHYEPTAEDAERAGRELENPFGTADVSAVERGRAVYEVYCQLCHGVTGSGDGTVAQRGFPTPASLLAANARNLPDGRIFHIVTYGQGNMPGHASQIEPEDRWRAALWVRQLQADAGPLPPTELDTPGDGVEPPPLSAEEAAHES